MEKPRTNRLRDELRSTNCRLERPTAVIMPNSVQNSAPRTGSGNDANRALNLPTIPSSSISAAPYWITRLLPTYTIKHTERRNTLIYFHLMCYILCIRMSKQWLSVMVKGSQNQLSKIMFCAVWRHWYIQLYDNHTNDNKNTVMYIQ